MTLIEKYISYLRYERNYSLHTEISYSTDLRQFEVFLNANYSEVSLETVDEDLVRHWIMFLVDQGVSARSVNRKLSSLKSFYKYLLRVKFISQNPLKRLVGPKSKKPIPSFVNHRDLLPLLDTQNADTFESLRNKVILELFYVTGIRRAELISLKDLDVDLIGATIKVTGKRNKQRLIPVSYATIELILQYISIRDQEINDLSGYLFVRGNGEQLYPMLVYRIVRDNLKFIPTLAKTSPHVLRHSFATGMLNNGADINAVKELLGHSSLAATEIYTHTSLEELKNIYNKAHPRA